MHWRHVVTPAVTHQKPHVFFDAADTLFRLSEPVGNTYAKIAAEHGWEVDPVFLNETFIDCWKKQRSLPPDYASCPSGEQAEYLWWQTLVTNLFEHASCNPTTRIGDPVEGWFNELYDHYANASAWHLFCDTQPALQRLQYAEIPIHVLSNFDHRLDQILKGFGIYDKFATVTTSSLAQSRKPDRKAFDRARAAAGSPEHCIHIGDDPINDRTGALGAGFDAILVDRRSGIDLVTIADKLVDRL